MTKAIAFLLLALNHSAMGIGEPPTLALVEREIVNADGSVSLVNPTVARGEERLSLSRGQSNMTGVCHLLGYDAYLEHTAVGDGDLPKTAIINERAQTTGFQLYGSGYNRRVANITCYRGSLPSLVFKQAEKVENADGSTTVKSPMVWRAHHRYPVSSTSALTGLCVGLGFDGHLPNTEKVSGDHQWTTRVSENSTFHGYVAYGSGYNRAVDSLSCFKRSTPVKSVYSAVKTERNADGSTSVYHPQLKRGNETFSISSQSSLMGVCKAFGFDRVLGDTVINSGDLNVTVTVNESMEFTGYVRYGSGHNRMVDHVACYSGDAPRLVPSYASKKQNPDGSWTIHGPQMKRGAGVYLPSGASSATGICRHFGVTNYLPDTLSAGGDHEVTLVVSATGEYQGFQRYGNGHNRAVTRLTCYD